MTRSSSVLAVVVALAGCTCAEPPRPTLESITPGRVLAGAPAAFTVRGTGFAALVQADFDAPASSTVRADFALALVANGSRIALVDVTAVSDRELSAALPAGAAAGVYDLALVDPRGRSAVLNAAFIAHEASCPQDGGPCDDGSACTRGETCVLGACGAPVSTVTCAPLGVCRAAGSCDPATGACSDPPAPDGTPCDDEDACTGGDACQGGATCVPGARVCGNTVPAACLAVTPRSGIAGATAFSFDPSCSWDADELVTSLEARLDFDGDGVWDTAFEPATAATVHVYPATGLHEVAVEVRDSGGLSGFAARYALVIAEGEAVVVTTSADEEDSGASPAAPGRTGLSLREAINWVNGAGAARTIQLGIAAPITHDRPLPALTVAGTRVVGAPGATLSFPGVTQAACVTLDAPAQLLLGVAITGCRATAVALSARSTLAQVAESTIGPSPATIGIAGQGTGVIGPRNDLTGVGTAVRLTSDGYVVEGNRIHGNEAGVSIAGATATLRGNLVYRNASAGVQASPGPCTVLHNVFDANGGDGLSAANAAAGLTARNNLFTRNGGFGIRHGAAGSTLDHNGFFSNASGPLSSRSPDTTDVLADPLFTRGHALAPTSPAIDRGIVTPGLDVNGPAAGQWDGVAPDLGAVEAPYPGP